MALSLASRARQGSFRRVFAVTRRIAPARLAPVRLLSSGVGGDGENKSKPDLQPAQLNWVAQAVPGVGASFAVMTCGFAAADVLGIKLLELQGISEAAGSPISGIPVSILLGMLIKNTVTVPKMLDDGIKLSSKAILQAGIICVGAKLSMLDLVTVGLVGFPAVCASIGVGLTFIPWFGRKMGIPDKMGSLIAAGTSICGVTAISALSPAIKASQRDTSFAIANVAMFGTLGMLTMPYLAHAVLPTSQQIGVFLGLSVHDTSQVIGTALTYSALYGDENVLKVATITKLTRNLFLAGVIPGLSYLDAKREGQVVSNSMLPTFADFKKYFPGFVAGFVGMSAVRTTGDWTLATHGAALGVLDAGSWKSLISFVGGDLGSQYLLGTAMAAVGLSTSISALKGVGIRPFVVGLAGVGAVSTTAFVSATVLGHLVV